MSPSVTLMMIGPTGVGKSATVNQILGEKKCDEGDSGVSVTSTSQVEHVKYNEIDLTLVDTPGVMDTAVDHDGAKIITCDDMLKAIDKCPETGKCTLCLVIKFGDRFTEEMRTCLYILKLVFGDDFLEKFCVVIVTHGDYFDITYKGKKSFSDWCRDETGHLGELFKSCSYRCVLFRNETSCAEEKKRQLNELITHANILEESYTITKFKEGLERHKRLQLEAKLTTLIECSNKKILNLEREIDEEFAKETDEERLIKLKDEASKIEQELNDNDKDVFYDDKEESLLKDPKVRIERILHNLDEKIQLNILIVEINDELKTLRKQITEKENTQCGIQIVKDLELEFQSFLEKYKNNYSLDLLNIASSKLPDESKESDQKTHLNEKDPVLFKDIERNSQLLKEQLKRFKHDVVKDRIDSLNGQLKEILPTETKKDIPQKINTDANELLQALVEDDEEEKNMKEELNKTIKSAVEWTNICSASKKKEILSTVLDLVGHGLTAVAFVPAGKALIACSEAVSAAKARRVSTAAAIGSVVVAATTIAKVIPKK